MKYAVKADGAWLAWCWDDPIAQGGAWIVPTSDRDVFSDRAMAERLAEEHEGSEVVEV